MEFSAFVVETSHDTGRWSDDGKPIVKKIRSHFDDLSSAVNSYNSSVNLGCFVRIRLLKFNPHSNRYDTLAVGDSQGSSLSVLDYETVSAALTGRNTSQITLEVF